MSRIPVYRVNSLPSIFASSLFLSIIAILLHGSGAAELPISATLDEVLALATRSERPDEQSGFDVDRSRALHRLAGWPAVNPRDEARIKAAFTASLRASPMIQHAAARGLGQRGHRDMIPKMFELGETDPTFIVSFFNGYSQDGKRDAPVASLRRGLRSKNIETRVAIVRGISACRAIALRPDLEAVLSKDPSWRVQDEAAAALGRLGTRESASVLRRTFDGGLKTEGVVAGLIRLGTDGDVAAVFPLLKHSPNWSLRRTIAALLPEAQVLDSGQICDALLAAFEDPKDEVRVAAMQSLAHFRETRALPLIRAVVTDPLRPISWHHRYEYVKAVAAIGGAGAIALLDDMAPRFAYHFGLEKALIAFGSASSARAIWPVYRKDPIRTARGGDVLVVGYSKALEVLAACADAEQLHVIEGYMTGIKDPAEKASFRALLPRLRARLILETVFPWGYRR